MKPNRIISNSFISGEISPELYGRYDLKAYFQAAASLHNFIVRRTGGIRKRGGTQLLTMLDVNAEAVRIVSYLFDRTKSALLVLYKKPNNHTIFGKLLTLENGALIHMTDEFSVPKAAVNTAADLTNMKIQQFGDKIYFTRRGMRSFFASIYYNTRQILFNQVPTIKAVDGAPDMTASPTGFKTDKDEGYLPSTREYRLYGVKDGIYSAEKDVTAKIYLPWVAGAKVTLSFTPDWTNHDYYLICKKVGADWGILQSKYPSYSNGSPEDVTWTAEETAFLSTATINEVAYCSGEDSFAGMWNKNPDEEYVEEGVENEYHKSGAMIANAGIVSFQLKSSKSAPILAIRIYAGALLRRANEVDTVDTVSTSGVASIALEKEDSPNAYIEIAKWDNLTMEYSSAPMILTVNSPVQGPTNGKYRVRFHSENGMPIVLRGFVVNTDASQVKFVDNNIEPSELQGIQEPLTVGTSGMDCDSIAIWQQRMMFASSMTLPFSFWFSQAGDIENFYMERPQTAASAFTASIPPSGASKILHVASSKHLLFFTESGEYLVSTGENQAFAFNTINIVRTSNIGADPNCVPVTTEQWVLFLAQDRRTVYEVSYELQQDSLVPHERTTFAMHLTENARIVKGVYQRFPDSVIWFLLSNGTLIGMTYMPDQEVCAWHHHTIAPLENAKLVDIATTGSLTDEDDIESTTDVFLTYQATDGSGRVWIEKMRPMHTTDFQTFENAKCVDHAGYEEALYPASTNPERRVEAELVTLRPESPDNNAMGLTRENFRTVVRVRRTGSIGLAPNQGSLATMARTKAIQTDTGINLYTGDLPELPLTYINETGQMKFVSSDDYPCEIQSILFVSNTGD